MDTKEQVPLETIVELTEEMRQRRVDGTRFRQLVRLWLHLTANGKQTLYRELSSQYGIVERTVYRIISGDIKTIDRNLEDFMKRKLSTIGIPESKLEAAIEQHERENPNAEEERYSYDQMKPILDYLKENLGISPTRILGRDPAYFKKHWSATVSGEKYRYAERLRERTKLALSSGSWEEIENILNGVYGREPGERVLYQRVKPLLDYLESKGESIKKLLGRSKSYYESLKLGTISRERCEEIIGVFYEQGINAFMDGDIKERKRLSEIILSSVPYFAEGKNAIEENGFTRADATSEALGMSKIAFDLLIAENTNLFRSVFVRRVQDNQSGWYVPDLYITKLKESFGFNLIKDGYTLLARKSNLT